MVMDAALRLTFFWFNFMPLTRGSAAVGWAVLMALLLACDIEVCEPPPEGLCLDWEAILTPNLDDFRSATREWLTKAVRPRKAPIDELPAVREVFSTYGAMIVALTAAEPEL